MGVHPVYLRNVTHNRHGLRGIVFRIEGVVRQYRRDDQTDKSENKSESCSHHSSHQRLNAGSAFSSQKYSCSSSSGTHWIVQPPVQRRVYVRGSSTVTS